MPSDTLLEMVRHIGKLEAEIERLRTRERARELTATATWDPASIGAGAVASTTVSCTGAAAGDPAIAGFSSITGTGWRIYACAYADNVRVVIQNDTLGAVDLPQGTVKVVVRK